jgi:hypothetical protein
MANNTRYTYITFANDVLAIVNGAEVTAEIKERVTLKANDLIATQTAKAEYNKANPKKSTAKGASEATKANGAVILSVLTAEPMTASEICAVAGVELTALQVANAVKFLEGVQSAKVIRETVNAKGLRAQKEYTAYFKA